MIIKWVAVGLMAVLALGSGAAAAFKIMGRVGTKTPPITVNKQITETDNNRCLVTVLGNIYDVTRLANSHGGPRGISSKGGFFKCGTNMSSEYTKEHGEDLSRLRAYLIIESNVNAPEGKNPTSQETGGDEDEEEED